MMPAKSTKCTICGRRMNSKSRSICAYCHRGETGWDNSHDPELKSPYEPPVPPRNWQHMTDGDTILHLKDFIRRYTDIGESSRPVVYIPGTPEFNEIARLYA